MLGKKTSALAALVLFNNALILSFPADACGPGCEDEESCLISKFPTTCDDYSDLEKRQECNSLMSSSCCPDGDPPYTCITNPRSGSCAGPGENLLVCHYKPKSGNQCPF